MGFWQQITENERIALNDIAGTNKNWKIKYGPVNYEGVKFTIFAAGIDASGKIAEEFGSQFPPGKRSVEFARIDANSEGAEAVLNKTRSKLASINAPQGKNGGHLKAREIPFAVGTEVLQENVTKSKMADAAIVEAGNGFGHARFVYGVGTLGSNANLFHRQAY